MTKTIIIRVSDSEYFEIQHFVQKGRARTMADFVHTGTRINLERIRTEEKLGGII
jgi:hypothetical protein